MPLISVVIPAYSCEKTIREAVGCALGQTVDDLEVIVVDDQSPDHTAEVVNDMAQEDRRVRLIRNVHNKGAAESRNIGCEAASGKYIAFLDSDDFWLADKLEKQLEILSSGDADLCYTSYSIIPKEASVDTESGKLYQVPMEIDYDGLLKENVICCSTVLLKSELLETHRFSSQFFHEDYILWLELLRSGVKARGIPELKVVYREGGRSSNKLRSAYYRWQIYRKVEKLSFSKSIQCFWVYAKRGLKKYYSKS